MSITLIRQAYTEARRLVIAGSLVAHGDFRLKKLIAPLEAAGKQAPVFSKIAEAAKAVVEGPSHGTTTALLELSSLTTAVLYTQGETGLAGNATPLKTTELGGQVLQLSARRLKPLLVALSTTGGGRWDIIQQEEKAGLFHDLRLVRPALKAIDDSYSEIGEIIATKVLPIYGTAIIPELKAKFEPTSSKAGHPRRLTLLHKLDAAAARELVMTSLETGSKEVKVAAIACLGPDDLPTLLEFVKAKAQDVRGAAYTALAKVNHPDAVKALDDALSGKDYTLAGRCIEGNASAKLVNLLVPKIRSGVAELGKLKDKKAVSTAVERLKKMLMCMPKGSITEFDQVLIDIFERRHQISMFKGESWGGTDLIETVFDEMLKKSKHFSEYVIAKHSELNDSELRYAFSAATEICSASDVYETFSPYLMNGHAIIKNKFVTDCKFDAIEYVLKDFNGSDYWTTTLDDQHVQKYDPRWLDLAINLRRLHLVVALGRKVHSTTAKFAKEIYSEEFNKVRVSEELLLVLSLLMRIEDPELTELFFRVLQEKKVSRNSQLWFATHADRLPHSSLSRVEDYVAKRPAYERGYWIHAINKLRERTT